MLKLWGRLSSVNVQKVVWALDEIGAPYERIDAGGPFGVVDTPDFLRMNPNGLVPVIDDSGFVLWESNAIVRYLSARHAEGSLWPTDVQVRADADRWMDWQATAFQPALGPAFMNLVRTPEDKRDARAVEASRKKSESMAAILDAHLAGRAFLAGDAFTMGDIPVGCVLHRWFHLPFERTRRPNLDRYYDRLRERPATTQIFTLPLT
jgi:glutathione S-transferase